MVVSVTVQLFQSPERTLIFEPESCPCLSGQFPPARRAQVLTRTLTFIVTTGTVQFDDHRQHVLMMLLLTTGRALSKCTLISRGGAMNGTILVCTL